MELVYLWVEDYKNIHHQGFNFSPRFTCKYENDVLTIDEKKDYVNIFPNNINVTAIVGENGSGKSSLLESLQDVLSENFSKWFEEEKYRKYIVIYKYDGKYFYIAKHMNDIIVIDKKEEPIDWIEKNPNSRLLEWHSDILTLILQNEVKPKTHFREDKQIFIEQTQITDKNKVKKFIIMNAMNNASFKEESKKFFNPDKIFITIKWHNLFNKKDDSDKYDEEVLKEIQLKVDEAKQNFKDKKYKDCFLGVFEICTLKKDKLKKPTLSFTVQTNGYMSNYFEAEKNYSCLSKTTANYPIKDLHKETIDKLNEFENMAIEIDKLDKYILEFIFDLPDFIFDIEIKDNDKSFDDLSFGERQLLTQLNCILFYANKKQYIQYEGFDYFEDEDGREHEVNVDYEKKIKSMLVLLDEFEVGLHPNWQKKAIQYIIDFLQNIKDIDFNLILTSHSPFILSDLPKENVIFLEKGKQVDPNIETFGANIHTLLSHGFFMKDGLMGEFAKEKIQSIINYHQKILKKELTKEENKKLRDKEKENYEKEHQATFRQIQSIIGDNYLKQVVKNHLVEIEKIVLGNDEAKQNEIDRLQAQIDLLKSNDA